MKHMRKILALALALMLVLGLATTASADTVTKNDSITVTNAIKDETYNLYKLFDLVVDSETDPKAYSYTVNSDWKTFFTGDGAKYIDINDKGYVTSIKDATGNVTENAKDLAKAAAAWTSKPTATRSVVATNNTVVFDNLPDGYWLITSTLGTLAMIETTPDKESVSINEKNPVDSITKEVKEDSSLTFGKENDAQIGDTVEFKSEVTLNPHTTNVKIHDTMDSGLTYNNDVKIYTTYDATTKTFSNELAAANYEIQAQPDSGDTFTISFKQSYLDALTGETKLYLSYTAVLDEDAIVKNENSVAIVDQNNKTTITYGDKQSVTDQTTTTTHKFSVFKHAKDSTDNLAGAVFSLKKANNVVNLIKIDDNNYRVAKAGETGVATFITVANGDIVIWGVDADNDYTLLETEAPAGYNKLTAEKNVTVDEGNSTRIDVENNAGTTLPETGGIGTTIFYVVGGLLVLAAIVLLVTKKRMASAK